MRVAVIGASNNRAKFGNKAVRSYASHGHEVIPINPTEPEIEGIKAYPTVADAPGPIDQALMYVPPSVGITLLPEIKAKGVGEIFLNPGTESDELLKLAEELGLKTIQACAILAIGETPSRWG